MNEPLRRYETTKFSPVLLFLTVRDRRVDVSESTVFTSPGLCVFVPAADNYIRNATVVAFYAIEWRHDRSRHCPSATRVKLHFKRKKLARLFQSSSRVSVFRSPFSREITLSRLFIVLMRAFYVLLASAWNVTCVLSVALITLQINWMRVGCIRRDAFIACSCKF